MQDFLNYAYLSRRLGCGRGTAAATVLWVGLFELNSLAVFHRAVTVARQVKYRSKPS